MINILEKKLLEEDYTSLDLAAALLKMMMGEESEDIVDTREPRSLDDLDSYYSGGSRNGNGRGRGRNSDAVLKAMKDVKIKGKNIHMEKANGGKSK